MARQEVAEVANNLQDVTLGNVPPITEDPGMATLPSAGDNGTSGSAFEGVNVAEEISTLNQVEELEITEQAPTSAHGSLEITVRDMSAGQSENCVGGLLLACNCLACHPLVSWR